MCEKIKKETRTKVIIIGESDGDITSVDVPFDKARILKLLKEVDLSGCKDTMDIRNFHSVHEYEDYVFIRKVDGFKKVAVKTITYLEAGRNYCDVHLNDGSCLNLTIPMKEVYEYLSPRLFKRVHRSFIVNLEHIDTYMGNMLILDGGKTITIGREYKDLVKEEFVCIGSRKWVRDKQAQNLR